MVRVASLFSQLLQHFPRAQFEALARKHNAERHAKGFNCWTQFVAMLFCQLGRADSLREICGGLSCCLGKLVHVGIDRPPNKSTLSYANRHRPAAFYEAVFWSSLERFRSDGALGPPQHKFRFKNKLLSLDSTVVTLCLSLFPWADYRRAKGGIKLHVLLDHDDYLPQYALITDARQHDVRAAHLLDLTPGSIVVEDRGYNDYALFGKWTDNNVYFVTRLKEGAAYEIVTARPQAFDRDIHADQDIRLTGTSAEEKCPHTLRRVVVWDAENGRSIVLLTNIHHLAATTLGDIYKDRWQIELFFKALKQNLKIKTFVGTSENALRIQIWTALLAMLLLKWLHHLSRAGWSLSTMAAMLRMNLFTYRALREWLEKPFDTPPMVPSPEQLALPLAGLGQRPSFASR